MKEVKDCAGVCVCVCVCEAAPMGLLSHERET